jgi:hypothetical protein
MQGISSQSFLITTTGLAMGAKGAKASGSFCLSLLLGLEYHSSLTYRRSDEYQFFCRRTG